MAPGINLRPAGLPLPERLSHLTGLLLTTLTLPFVLCVSGECISFVAGLDKNHSERI